MKRWCKRPPAHRVTGAARQTPPGARPDRQRSRAARPSCRVGRWRAPATASGDGWPPPGRRGPGRGTGDRIRLTVRLVRTRARALTCAFCPMCNEDDVDRLLAWAVSPLVVTGGTSMRCRGIWANASIIGVVCPTRTRRPGPPALLRARAPRGRRLDPFEGSTRLLHGDLHPAQTAVAPRMWTTSRGRSTTVARRPRPDGRRAGRRGPELRHALPRGRRGRSRLPRDLPPWCLR